MLHSARSQLESSAQASLTSSLALFVFPAHPSIWHTINLFPTCILEAEIEASPGQGRVGSVSCCVPVPGTIPGICSELSHTLLIGWLGEWMGGQMDG